MQMLLQGLLVVVFAAALFAVVALIFGPLVPPAPPAPMSPGGAAPAEEGASLV